MCIRLILSVLAILLSTQVAADSIHPQIPPTALSPHSSPSSSKRPSFPYPHASNPASTVLLYSQLHIDFSTFQNAAPSQKMPIDWMGYSAVGADDFSVTDPTGWNVSAFNFRIWFTYQSLHWPAPPGTTYTIDIYRDQAGLPAPNPVCRYTNLNGEFDNAGSTEQLSVSLTSSCFLPKGTYWVALQIVTPDYPPQAWWMTSPVQGLGAHAAWQNHFEGFGFGCSAWTDITQCTGMVDGYPDPQPLAAGESAFQFEIVGSLGGDSCNGAGPGICLETTVGTDLAPGACGATKSLDVVAGDWTNYCYKVTNHSGVALAYQSLSDNINGTLLSRVPESLPDGATYQMNRIVRPGATQAMTSAWTSQNSLPGYDAVVTGVDDIVDRFFCDGFDGQPCQAGSSSGFIDITSIGTSTGLREDKSVPVSMPFSFNFFGTTSNNLCIDENGLVFFGTTNCPMSGYWNNGATHLPSPDLPMPTIMPLWNDFTDTSGDVFYATIGTAPNRKFVIEWYDRVAYDGALNTNGATFEVVFHEASGKISFEYADVDYTAYGSYLGIDQCNGGLCATIALQGDPTLADQFSFLDATVANGTGIDWLPRSVRTFASNDTVVVDVGEADIEMDPTSVSGSVRSGMTSTFVLDINNVGTRDLNWSLDSGGNPQAHFPPPGSRFAMPMGDPTRTSPRPRQMSAADKWASAHKSRKSFARVPFASGVAPTFAADVYNDELITLDASAPFDSTANVASSLGFKLTGGTYIGGDFSTMYAVDGFGESTTNRLVKVDTATGNITPIGDPATLAGQFYSSLKYDATTDTLYASSISGDCTTPSMLWTVDRTTGVATFANYMLGTSCIVALAIDRSGLMYGIDIREDALYAIDKTSGQTGLIGSIGFNANYAQDADFDQATGILYFAGFDDVAATGNMYTVNTTTGLATMISPVGPYGRELDAIAIQTAYGPCSGAQSLSWLTMSPMSGTTPRGTTSPVTLTINAQDQAEGTTLSGAICVSSNDRDERLVAVPIEYVVKARWIAPTVAKSFLPAALNDPSGSSVLTITLGNQNDETLTLGAELFDQLPDGLKLSQQPNASTDCPSAQVAAPNGGTYVSLNTGTQIPAQGSCSVSVSVTASNAGVYTNTIPAGALQTQAGSNTAPATADLAVGGSGGIVNVFVFQFVDPAQSGGNADLYLNWKTGALCTSSQEGGCQPTDYNIHFGAATGLSFDWPHSTDQCLADTAVNGKCRVLDGFADVGTVVGPTSITASGSAANWHSYHDYSFMGFSFLNPDTGAVNYGYVQLSTQPPDGFPTGVIQYWYDSSGAPITVNP